MPDDVDKWRIDRAVFFTDITGLVDKSGYMQDGDVPPRNAKLRRKKWRIHRSSIVGTASGVRAAGVNGISRS